MPNYFYSPRFEEWRKTGGERGWDGYNYPVRKVGRSGALCLRGHRDNILERCQEHGIDVDKELLLPRPFARLTADDVPPDVITAPFLLDDNQRVGIASWLQRAVGVNQMTVSGGKTALFGGAAAMVKAQYPDARFIYITPSERLVRQSFAELKKFLPHFEISQFGGGRRDKDGRDMVVCTVAILHKHYARLNAQGWLKTFMCVCFDEVQHAPSTSAKRVLLAIPAYFRFGASDSIKEDDPPRHNEIIGLFGQILNRVNAEKLIDAGRLAKPHIYVVDIKEWHNKYRDVPYVAVPQTEAIALLDNAWQKGTYQGPVYEKNRDGKIVKQARSVYEDNQWKKLEVPVVCPGLQRVVIKGREHELESRYCLLCRAYDQAIIRFQERNALIAHWAQYYSSQGRPTVVVCTRTLHVFILENLIQEAIGAKNVEILVGQDSSAERDAIFAWFKEKPGRVLITPLIKEGVSINEIRAMVIADYVGNWEVANQIVGRALRKKETRNWAEITWFIENQYPQFRRSSREVISRLAAVGGYQVYDGINLPADIPG